MRPELRSRLDAIALGGFAQKPPVTASLSVTRRPVTGTKLLKLLLLPVLPVKNDEIAKDAGQPVIGSIAGPVESDQAAIDERAGFVIDGGVPAVYADAWSRLQCQKPGLVSDAQWRQALHGGGRFFDAWAGLAIEWSPGDLFDVPTYGRSGLIWWLCGEAVRSLGGDCAFAARGRVYDRVTRLEWQNPYRGGIDDFFKNSG